MVYTSFFAGTSDMYIISRLGGARHARRHRRLNLNTSATFSPISNDIAFVGSIAGNPTSTSSKTMARTCGRLTHDSSIESTPEWSPNGRQISFTSDAADRRRSTRWMRGIECAADLIRRRLE